MESTTHRGRHAHTVWLRLTIPHGGCSARQYQIGAQVVKKLEATGHEAGIALSAHGYRRGRVAGSGARSRHRFMEAMDAVPYWTTRQQA